MLMKKSIFILSVFTILQVCPAVADIPEGYTEYSTFPTMTGVDYMKEKSVYKNAAVAANMLGITSGTIYAEPVYLTVSCPANQYLTDDSACANCPSDYPKSNGESGGIAKCYKTVTRGCTQNPCSCQSGSDCTCAACNCAGETYIAYHDGTTSGTVSNEVCNQTIATASSRPGYFFDDDEFKACEKGFYQPETGNATSCIEASNGYYVDTVAAVSQKQCPAGYRDGSNNGRDDITDCYKTVARGCTKNECVCQEGSTCVCADCECTGGTYTQYVAADGVSNGAVVGVTTNLTCNKTVSSTTCNAGYYMKNGTCTACAKGTYKSTAGNATSCTEASDGYYVATTGATSQTQCPAGYRDGSNNGRDAVTDCYKTVTRGCTQNACSCQGESSCVCADCECTGGTYTQYVAADGVSNGTTNGTTSNETCNQTVASTTCNAGYYMKNGTCTACAKGTYKSTAGNAASCTEASDGYYVATTGATSQTQCPAGYRDGSNNGRDAVTDCYKTVTRGCTQNACSCQGESSCVCADCECTGGTYKRHVASNGTSEGEAEGTSSNETCNQTVASTTCNAGYYMKNGTCTACAKGTYKSTAGNATSCTVASEGYYVSSTAATSQTKCPAGLVSPQGTTSDKGCGKVMYVDNTKLYLTSEKQTSPALAVRIDGKVYYANTTAGAKPMSSSTTKSLRTRINGVEYSIHDNTVQGE